MPCLFLTASSSIAEYGHATRQSQHPLQVVRLTFAVIGSLAIWSLEKSARTLLAAALPIETDSGISIGPTHVPASKTHTIAHHAPCAYIAWYVLQYTCSISLNSMKRPFSHPLNQRTG